MQRHEKFHLLSHNKSILTGGKKLICRTTTSNTDRNSSKCHIHSQTCGMFTWEEQRWKNIVSTSQLEHPLYTWHHLEQGQKFATFSESTSSEYSNRKFLNDAHLNGLHQFRSLQKRTISCVSVLPADD